MPYQRIKDGKVIEEHATKQPTTEEAEASKRKEIAMQNEQRKKFEADRKADKPAEKSPVKDSTKPAAS